MPIEFITLPKEQAKTNINRLREGTMRRGKLLRIVLTNGISAITKEIHERALRATGKKPGGNMEILIQTLAGRVHGINKAELEDLIPSLKGRIKEATHNATTWKLIPQEVRIIFRKGVAILGPAEGSLEIPRPEDPALLDPPPSSEPKIPKRIETILALKKAFAALIRFYVKPGATPEDALKMRKKLQATSTSSAIIKRLIKELLAKTIFLSSKNASLRPTRESLFGQFVTDLDQQTVSLEPPPETGEGGDSDETLDEDDFELFDPEDRREGRGDYKDPPVKKAKPDDHDNPIYEPQPEDFEDRPEEPDEDDET